MDTLRAAWCAVRPSGLRMLSTLVVAMSATPAFAQPAPGPAAMEADARASAARGTCTREAQRVLAGASALRTARGAARPRVLARLRAAHQTLLACQAFAVLLGAREPAADPPTTGVGVGTSRDARPGRDDSAAAPFPPATMVVASCPGHDFDVRGRVTQITPRELWIDLGSSDPQHHGLRVGFPRPVSVPLSGGDGVRARATVRTAPAPALQVLDVTVADAAGALIYADSQSGDAAIAEGWVITRGAAFDSTAPGDFALVMRHDGRTAVTRANDWRMLVTPDGTWLLAGHEFQLAGRPTRNFTILRIR